MEGPGGMMMQIQSQVRQNQAELSDYMKGLDAWEDDIKKKDDRPDNREKEATNPNNSTLPPVRNSLLRKKKKKKVKQTPKSPKSRAISGYDFKAWDKFDVDKALEDVDCDDGDAGVSSSSSETDEEWEVERLKQQALMEKDKGNALFKKGDYDAAVECYTKAIECDPTNPVLPANRAMALLKQSKYAAAETDCTLSLTLDPLYIKAYLRRASARASLDHTEAAKEDYQRVLQLEPTNKLATSQLDALNVKKKKPEATTEGDETIPQPRTHVFPIYKPPDLRSKKPLYRVPIEEIGNDKPLSVEPSTQSATKQRLTARDELDFNLLISNKTNNEADDNEIESKFPQNSELFAKNLDLLRQNVGATPESSSPLITEVSSRKIPPLDLDNINHDGGGDGGNYDIESENLISECKHENFGQENDITSLLQQQSKISPRQNENSGQENDITSLSQKQSNISPRQQTSTSPRQPSSDKSPRQQFDSSPRQPSDKTPTTSPDSSPRLPPAPQTSLQFQCDWRKLQNHPALVYEYMVQIAPSQYKQLIGQFMDADVLVKVVDVLLKFYIRDKRDVYPVLQELAKVQRFSMVLMFLNTRQKQMIKELLSAAKSSPHFNSDVHNRVMKLYDVKE